RNSPEAAGLPFAQVILHASFAGLAKQSPRLPTRARHHGDACKFSVGVLGAVASSKRLDEANDLAAFFEACLHERQVDEVGEQRISGDKDVSSGDEHADGATSEFQKETPQPFAVFFIQNGETRERASLAAV